MPDNDYTYKVVDGEAILTRYTGKNMCVKIPAEIDGYPVTGLHSTFANHYGIKEVVVPSSVKTITLAFDYCQGLEKVELSKGLVEINFWSFRECRSLKELVIPETVKTIMGNCFEMCGIEKIHIPDTIEDIDQLPQRVTNFEEPFIKNGNLLYVPKDIVSYEIPYGVRRICINAFANCQKLEQVIIPDTVKDICYDAFRECSSLRSVRVPDSVEMLDMGVFGYCTALEEIVLPSKLEVIKSFTFNKCTKLKSVRLSRKTQVEQFAFCDSTEIIYVD